MEFDIIEISEGKLKELTAVQMQLLRTAQKKKNELAHNMEQDLALFKKLVYTDDMKQSSLLEQKRAELTAEFDREVEILAEQLLYSMELSEPLFPDDEGNEDVGYVVDYSLSYTERYVIVRNYYIAIPDPYERIALYDADEVAKKYLGSYYTALYDVLLTYCK